MKLIFSILLILVVNFSYPQYIVDWSKGFGGEKSDKAMAVIETIDNNILVVGSIKKRREFAWALMINEYGNPIWGKTYEENWSSGFNSVIKMRDSSFIVCGYYSKSRREKNKQGMIMKLDKRGNPVWRKKYGEEEDDELFDILIYDDGFIAVGYSISNVEKEKAFWILKTDFDGNFINEKKIDDSEASEALAVIKTTDRNFAFAGFSSHGGSKMGRVIKFDEDLNTIWNYSSEYSLHCEFRDLTETKDEQIIAAGTKKMNNTSDFDALLIKIDKTGQEIWTKTYGFERWEEATNIIHSYDGNMLFSGFVMYDNRNLADFWLRKADTDGHILWEHTYKMHSLDYPYGLTEANDNSVYLSGETKDYLNSKEYAVLKYRDLYKTNFKILNLPVDTNTTVNKLKKLDICIRSFKQPKKVEVIVNGIMQVNNAFNSRVLETADCKYPVYADISLQEGYNDIKVIVIDRRDKVVIKEKVLYYIPSNDLNW